MKKILFFILAGFFVSCTPEDDEPVDYTTQKASADSSAKAEDAVFDNENREFDTSIQYTIPEKLNYFALTGLENTGRGENNIFPIGFSADWKQFAYITQSISPNRNHVVTQLLILDPRTPDQTSKLDLDTSYKEMDFKTVWNRSVQPITQALRKHYIIQEPVFIQGETFMGRYGKIILKSFDVYMKRMEENGMGKHVSDYIYAYNDKNDSVLFKRMPQLNGMELKGYGTLGAFVGKRYLYIFTLVWFTDILGQETINYRLEWCPLDITKYPKESAF